MSTPSPLPSLKHATHVTAQIVSVITPAQQRRSTPCAPWDVEALSQHLCDSFERYTAAFGAPTSGAESFETLAGRLLDTLDAEGALAGTVDVPVGTVPSVVAVQLAAVEAAVHGWDLAQAIGQPAPFVDELIAPLVPFSRQALAMVPAERSPFAPPQSAPQDAPAIDQLAALLGRRVTKR